MMIQSDKQGSSNSNTQYQLLYIPKHTISLFLVLLLVPALSFSQNTVWDNPKDATKKAADKVDKSKKGLQKWKDHIKNYGLDTTYDHQFALGGKLNSNGWSGCIYYFKRTKPGRQDIWQLSFSEIKHEKQIKQQKTNTQFPELGTSSPFVYGKINNLYTLNIGYGRQQMLLPGVVDGNLSVSFRYSAGFSLAMLKPYYLKLVQTDPNTGANYMTEERYTDSTAETFLKPSNILGASKWSKGLNETKFLPGAFAELAFVIEPNSKGWFVQTITLGANASIYTKPLPVMAEVKTFSWQANLFAGLSLGKRW